MQKERLRRPLSTVAALIAGVSIAYSAPTPQPSQSSEARLEKAAQDPSIARALVLLSGDERAQAFSVLEVVFKDDSSGERKLQAASLLAFGDGRNLKLNKQHKYAEYVLQSGKSLIPRNRLLRIIADGYFEDADLAKASEAYSKLAQSENPQDVDYAQFKLGWIDLNQRLPESAFKRWHQRVVDGSGRQQDLRRSLVRDLGRAWTETVPPTEAELSSVKNLKLEAGEQVIFADGMMAGLRRLPTAEAVAQIRAQLFQTPYVKAIVSRIISQGIGLVDKPCSITDWFGPNLSAKEIDSKVLAPRLSACLFAARKENPTKWQNNPQIAQLISVYKDVELLEYQRWPRAEVNLELNQSLRACSDYVLMLNEIMTVKKEAPIADVYGGLVKSCRAALESSGYALDAKMSVGKDFLKTLKIYTEAGKLTMDLNQPLYAVAADFASVAGFRASLFEMITSKPGEFQKTLLAALLLEKSSKEEKARHGATLFDHFSPKPLIGTAKANEVWLEALRLRLNSLLSRNQYHEAKVLLSSYLPMASSVAKDSADRFNLVAQELWTLWGLAVPATARSISDEGFTKQSTSPDFRSGMDLSAISLDQIKAPAKNSSEDNQNAIAMALGMKFGLYAKIWSKWRLIRPTDSKHFPLIAEFYQKSFDLIREGKLRRSDLGDHPEGLLIADIADLKTADPSRIKEIEKLAERSAAGLSLNGKPALAAINDLRMITQLGKGGKKIRDAKLAFNSKLPGRLQGYIADLQSQIKSIGSHQWSDEYMVRLGKDMMAETCEQFAKNVEKLAHPRGLDEETAKVWGNQVNSIVQQIRGWKDGLKKADAQKKGMTS